MSTQEQREELQAIGTINKLTFGHVSSLALNAILELGIPEILERAPGGSLSVKEIAEHLPSESVQTDFLFRIMRFAVLSGVLAEVEPKNTNKELPAAADGSDDAVVDVGDVMFASTRVSKMLIRENNPFSSLGHMAYFQTSRAAVSPWFRLSEAVLSGRDAPFVLEYGKNFFEMTRDDPELGMIFNKAMTCYAEKSLEDLMKVYKGFNGLRQLMDVGGGVGWTLAVIRKAYPEIQGVNFDLPHVVADAPAIPGVEHVAGDMFESVPKADAIIMKSVLHDWDDEHSMKILRNCHQALPEKGKVILIESVLPAVKEAVASPAYMHAFIADLVMVAHSPSGRERTAAQWRSLLTATGFTNIDMTKLPGANAIEAYKS